MKKTILFCFCFITASSIFAQRSNVQFGLKAGVNIADLSHQSGGRGSRTGFHVGALAHIHLARMLAVQPELVYSSQGERYDVGDQKLNYVNIPILIQYMSPEGLRLETGPQVGVLTSASYDIPAGTETDNKKSFKSSDAAWVFGLGYLSPSGLGLDARYNYGISDITKSSAIVKNRVWQFGVFYQFH